MSGLVRYGPSSVGCGRGGDGGSWLQASGRALETGWPGDPVPRTVAFSGWTQLLICPAEKMEPLGTWRLGLWSPRRGLSIDSSGPLVSVAIKSAELH